MSKMDKKVKSAKQYLETVNCKLPESEISNTGTLHTPEVINAMGKYLKYRVGVALAGVQGALDGLELDNKDDVVEKSTVIEYLNNIKALLTQQP